MSFPSLVSRFLCPTNLNARVKLTVTKQLDGVPSVISENSSTRFLDLAARSKSLPSLSSADTDTKDRKNSAAEEKKTHLSRYFSAVSTTQIVSINQNIDIS